MTAGPDEKLKTRGTAVVLDMGVKLLVEFGFESYSRASGWRLIPG
jgi:hypothetical protein